MVFEYKPKMDWNKGKALLWLLHELKLDNQDDVFTIYIGDDTTDEDAFCVLNDTSNPSGKSPKKFVTRYKYFTVTTSQGWVSL